jgi:ribosome-binding factor A
MPSSPRPTSPRMRRVNEEIKEILAEALPGMKDPRIGFVTLTDVRATTDLKQAEVFYTVLPDDEDTLTQTARGLASATPMLRRTLGARLRTRNTPDLHFTHDPVPARGRRIEALLDRLPPAAEDDDENASHDDP